MISTRVVCFSERREIVATDSMTTRLPYASWLHPPRHNNHNRVVNHVQTHFSCKTEPMIDHSAIFYRATTFKIEQEDGYVH